MKDLKLLVRPNILALEPYSSARDEYNKDKEKIWKVEKMEKDNCE